MMVLNANWMVSYKYTAVIKQCFRVVLGQVGHFFKTIQLIKLARAGGQSWTNNQKSSYYVQNQKFKWT